MVNTRYSGRGRGRTSRLPATAVTEQELATVQLAAQVDGVTVAYLVRAGTLTEARKRLRRAGVPQEAVKALQGEQEAT